MMRHDLLSSVRAADSPKAPPPCTSCTSASGDAPVPGLPFCVTWCASPDASRTRFAMDERDTRDPTLTTRALAGRRLRGIEQVGS
jgi:hypothetical protein